MYMLIFTQLWLSITAKN